jgi:hypothetical protein
MAECGHKATFGPRASNSIKRSSPARAGTFYRGSWDTPQTQSKSSDGKGLGMTLENMFYISQTVAGFAIVVSLLFVGMEVRHSNRESRLRTIQDALQNYRAARLSLIDNADVARAWISGLHDFTALDPVDKVRFLLTADSFFNNVQSFFLHHLEGVMPHEVYEPQRAVLDDYLGYPGLQAAWDRRKNYFHVAFRKSVEQRIAAVRSAGLVSSLYGEAR